MTARPARRLLTTGCAVLALAAACGSADEPAPPTTTESIPLDTQTDGGPADDPSPPPATGKSDPPSVQADGGRVAEPSAAPTTTEPVPPSTEADSAPVDDLLSTTTADSTEAPPAPRSVDADDPGALSADARSLIGSWHTAVLATAGVWPGFDLASIPAVLAAIDDEGTIRATVAFNHPNPRALGTLIRDLDVDGHKIAVIGEVTDPDWLASRAPFDFFADVGGTDTFVLISQEGELGLESGTPDFIATLVHEAFHRYQWDEWTPRATRQYIDSYDFSAANLELALLENRILIAAYQAEDPGDLEHLARQFAAVRATRHERDQSWDNRVAHDEAQERAEGSAQFVEHRIGDSIGNVYRTATNHTEDLVLHDEILSNPEALVANLAWYEVSIKTYFSFGRFYSSGATLLVLLDRLGVPDVAGRLRDGGTPAGLLERHIAPLDDLDQLVADAQAEHDPDGRLAEAAATLSELAIDEPPTSLGHDGESVLTVAQIACLEAHGIEIGDRIGIPQNVADECLVEADDSDGSSP